MKKAAFFSIAFLCLVVFAAGSIPVAAEEGKSEFFMDEGIAAFEDKDWANALSKFSEVLKLDPNNSSAYHYKGVTLIKLNQPDEALKDLLKSRELDPKAPDINLDVGQVYLQLGKPDEAEKAYREEIANHPENADAHFGLGYLLFKQGKYGECISEFLKARESDPNLGAAAKYYEGVAYYKMGDMKPAEVSFTDCLAKNPSPEMASAAKKYLDAIKTRKNWGVMGSVLYQYDSNVVTVSDQAEFPMIINDDEVSDQEDYRTVVTFAAFYRLTNFKPWIFEGRYGFYQSWHNEIDIYNLQNHSAGLSLYRSQKLFGKDTIAGLDYTFSEAWLGTDMEWFSVNHWMGTMFKVIWTKKFASTIGYRYNIEDFHVSQPDRDNTGNNVYCRLDYAAFEDKASLSLIAGMDFEDAEDPAYDIRRPWVKLYANAKLPLKVSAKLTLGYENEDHFNDDAQNRQDDVYIAEIMAYRQIWGSVDGVIGASYRDNESNVDSLTYERVIVGGGFVVKY